MNNIVLVQIGQPKQDAAYYKLGLLLGEASSFSDVMSHVASRQILHQEIEVLSVLHGVDHIDQEIVFKL